MRQVEAVVERAAQRAPGQVHQRRRRPGAAPVAVVHVATIFALVAHGPEKHIHAARGAGRGLRPVGGRVVAQVRDGRAHRRLGHAVPQQQRDRSRVAGRRGHHHRGGSIWTHPHVLHAPAVEHESRARRPVQKEPQRLPILRSRRAVVRSPTGDQPRHLAAHHRAFEQFLQRFLAPETGLRHVKWKGEGAAVPHYRTAFV